MCRIMYRSWSQDGARNPWSAPTTELWAPTGKPHRLPLSTRALAVLDEARRLGNDGLTFPSPTGRPLSDNTLSKALRTAEILATIHGMRVSLRDWLASEGVTYELAEAVLGHQPRGIAKSYRRDDLLDARRPIMERWAQRVARQSSLRHNP